jgi:cold shock CspA family protein/HJR/Mrr/RecB family endonuclease
MQGIIKKKVNAKGFGFILSDGFGKDLFFHRNSLVGVTLDELGEGDNISFETELISHQKASKDTILNGLLLRPYGEQKIITPHSVEAIRLEKKVTAEFIVRLSQNPTDLYQLNARDFEEVVAELYAIDGYTVELLGSWNEPDGGVDILAMKRDIRSHQFRMAIQCKRYAPENRVTAAPIRSLAGVLDRFHAHAGGIVTTSDFTKPAKNEAALHFWKLSLMNFQSVVEMLRQAELLVRPPITFSTDDRTNPPEVTEIYLHAVNVQRV